MVLLESRKVTSKSPLQVHRQPSHRLPKLGTQLRLPRKPPTRLALSKRRLAKTQSRKSKTMPAIPTDTPPLTRKTILSSRQVVTRRSRLDPLISICSLLPLFRTQKTRPLKVLVYKMLRLHRPQYCVILKIEQARALLKRVPNKTTLRNKLPHKWFKKGLIALMDNHSFWRTNTTPEFKLGASTKSWSSSRRKSRGKLRLNCNMRLVRGDNVEISVFLRAAGSVLSVKTTTSLEESGAKDVARWNQTTIRKACLNICFLCPQTSRLEEQVRKDLLQTGPKNRANVLRVRIQKKIQMTPCSELWIMSRFHQMSLPKWPWNLSQIVKLTAFLKSRVLCLLTFKLYSLQKNLMWMLVRILLKNRRQKNLN